MKLLFPVLLVTCLAVAGKEFPAVMAEQNLERRSDLALREADQAVSDAKSAYVEQKEQDFQTRLADVEELVELSYKSLQDTGKRARRSPKFYKRAELSVRALIRRLDSLSGEVSVDDREPVAATRKKLNDLHDQILNDIMTKK